ncbi:MAG TPA: hypothetical protein VN927_07315 [Gemmatimonadaceae bacterium]|nr:hypothetical protein [Gemmatimonadaceae bacterium]
MIEEISLERAGGQELVKRIAALNACALASARRLALNPSGAGRIRLGVESLPSYRDLSDMEIAHFAAQPVFLFRPSRLADALASPAAATLPPDGEMVRRFLMLLRDLALHAISSPSVILAIDPADTDKARKLTDDEIEALQRSPGLTFESRIEPSQEFRSSTADGWDQEKFLTALLRDLDAQLVKTQRLVPKSALRP